MPIDRNHGLRRMQGPVPATGKSRERVLDLGVEMYLARFGDEPPPKDREDLMLDLEEMDPGARIALTEALSFHPYEVFAAAVKRRQGTSGPGSSGFDGGGRR